MSTSFTYFQHSKINIFNIYTNGIQLGLVFWDVLALLDQIIMHLVQFVIIPIAIQSYERLFHV
jgi:hypothetical protein